MSKKKYTAEQIVTMLREAEVQVSKGQNIAEVCRGLGITDQTYYRRVTIIKPKEFVMRPNSLNKVYVLWRWHIAFRDLLCQ